MVKDKSNFNYQKGEKNYGRNFCEPVDGQNSPVNQIHQGG